MKPLSLKRHRFPAEVIRHAVLLYFRFSLSFRDVEELLAQRGIDVSYETIRCWTIKFGPLIARRLRKRRPRPTPHWHLDEMVCSIGGRRMYLWRAVDDEGEVLDLLVQRRRDTDAALTASSVKTSCFADGAVTPLSCSCTSAYSMRRLRPRPQLRRSRRRAEQPASVRRRRIVPGPSGMLRHHPVNERTRFTMAARCSSLRLDQPISSVRAPGRSMAKASPNSSDAVASRPTATRASEAAEMRLVPRSHFWICRKVTPSASPN